METSVNSLAHKAISQLFEKNGSKLSNSKVAALDYGLWPIHTLTHIQILRLCEDAGAEVFYSQNIIGHRPTYFFPYLSRRKKSLTKLLIEAKILKYKLIQKGYSSIVLDEEAKVVLKQINLIRTLADLKKIDYRGHPVGYTLSSTLVSQFRSTDIRVRMLRIWAKKYFRAYVQGYQDAMKLHLEDGYSAFVIFNGRFPSPRGASDYAIEKGLTLIAHDVEPAVARYTFLRNRIHSPESAIEFQEILESIKENDQNLTKSTDYYSSRFDRTMPSIKIFTQKWTEESKVNLPDTPYVAIFSSSDHEHYSITPDRDFEDLQTQMEWLVTLTRILLNEGLKVAVRIHPNAEISKRLIRETWMNEFSKNSNFHIYNQESSMDSYALAKNASIIVTTFSTIAAEYASMGKPVISTGHTLYEKFINLDKCNRSIDFMPLVRKMLVAEISDARRMELISGAERYGQFQSQRYFNFEVTPFLSELHSKETTLPPITETYRKLRAKNRFEELFVKVVFYFRYRILLLDLRK